MIKRKITIKMLINIFLTFLRISPLTFGGGYVMIPLLEREMVEKKKWIKSEDIVDIFAISESVPGAIAINSATFIGYHLMGIPGAIFAMLGMLLPSFIIILILATAFLRFQDNIYVQAAFRGIRPAIVGLIFTAAIKIGKVSVIDRTTLIIGAVTTSILLAFSHLHPVLMIFLGLMAGIAICRLRRYFCNIGG